MDIIEAIHDKNIFRNYLAADGDLKSWRNWLAFLRVLHGLKTTKGEHDTIKRCTGRDPIKLREVAGKDGFTEALLLCGRRSGKSKLIALTAVAEGILSDKHKNVSPGEIGMIAVVSPTKFQSRIVHSYMRAIFDASPLLRNELIEERRESFVLKNGVEVVVLAGDPRTSRGFSLIAAVIDEIAMHGLTEESKVRSDTELVRAIRPSLATTGGRLLAIGTPWKAAGYAHDTFRRCYGNDEADTLVWNAPSTLMNPTLDARVVARAIAEDAVAARVEFCVEVGLFREDVDEFIARSVVENLVIRGRKELPPRSGISYSAFVDVSGGRHDDAALCIGHREDRTIILDCLERYKAPHSPYSVIGEMTQTLKRYGINRAVADAYAAEFARLAFAEHGINLQNCSTSQWKDGAQVKNKIAKPKSVLYAELLPRLTSGEIELLDDEVMIVQLSSLQRRTRSGARDSIDHPPGGHDDVANVVAGVVDSVLQRRMTAGSGGSSHATGERGATPMDRAAAAFEKRRREYDRERQRLAEGHAAMGHLEGFVAEMKNMGIGYERRLR